jgi:hypothetical protein
VALSAIESQAAGATPVWVVWWEEPEKSWEALCLSPAEAEQEFAAREADHVLKHWGKVGKRDRQSLLEWLAGHLNGAPPSSADDYLRPAKEVLRRVSVSETGPVIVRTW